MARLPICLLVLCAAAPAAAQHARFPRQQPPPPAVALSALVQPAPATAAQPNAQPTKPTIGNDYVISVEYLKGPVRGEHEQILAKLIESTPDSEVEEKADFYFRLASLYTQQQQISLVEASKGSASQAASNNKAKEYLLKAVKTYKGLTDVETFRNYPKMDMALFQYGYTLQSGRYMKEARAVYDKLLKNYPTSKYVPEAHLVFGDYYFESGQLADAEARYKQVLKFPKSAVYSYALYKQGWVHLSLQRYQEALETFFQVVTLTRNDNKRAQLTAAARNDFVRAYAQIGKPDKAFDAFSRVDAAAAPQMVELLVQLTRDAGQHDRTIAAYRAMVAKQPEAARACEWRYRIAHGLLSLPGATAADKVAEISALVKHYRTLAPADDTCRSYASAMSGELAVAFHAEFTKTQNLDTLALAEQLYAAYASAFTGDATRLAAYAEVLWTRADREADPKRRKGRWELAAQQFGELGTSDGARTAVLAWMNAIDVSLPGNAAAFTKPSPPKARPRPTQLDTTSGRLVTALAAYLSHAPTADAELAQMRLAVATVLRKHKRFDEAAEILDVLLEQQPTDASAELAATLLLDSLVQGRLLDEAKQVAMAITQDAPFLAGKPHLQAAIASVLARR